MTARTTQPRLSKGPLGERGRRLQERLGVVPLAAITRRGAVPVWLRASWSGPLAAAKAAPRARRRAPRPALMSPAVGGLAWGTRLLICARFQPDWGKPNVRLIGGGRKPAPVGSAVRRAAPPAYPTACVTLRSGSYPASPCRRSRSRATRATGASARKVCRGEQQIERLVEQQHDRRLHSFDSRAQRPLSRSKDPRRLRTRASRQIQPNRVKPQAFRGAPPRSAVRSLPRSHASSV